MCFFRPMHCFASSLERENEVLKVVHFLKHGMFLQNIFRDTPTRLDLLKASNQLPSPSGSFAQASRRPTARSRTENTLCLACVLN